MSNIRDKLKYAASTADDWTKTQDKVQRKKIQDRLAQRKRREKASKSKATPDRDGTVSKPSRKGFGKQAPAPPYNDSMCDASPRQGQLVRNGIDGLPLDEYLEAPVLSEHRFLVLSEFSVHRAYVTNATMLAIDAATLADWNGLSPWTVLNPFAAPSESFPRSLRPTPLQLRIDHHPFLDLIAPAGLRDNILIAVLDDDQEDRFCQSIHQDGLRVWGEQPWSPIGWEFSQSFVDQWAWLMDEGSISSSNFWRFERGEPPLKLPNDVPSIAELA